MVVQFGLHIFDYVTYINVIANYTYIYLKVARVCSGNNEVAG